MKIKLIGVGVVLVCVLATVSAGLLSVYRSEDRLISPQAQQSIEAFLAQYDITLPAFLTQ